MTEVRDGGHSPVLVEITWVGPVTLNWQQPRARVPDLLKLPPRELRSSPAWTALLERWEQSSAAQLALDPQREHTTATLSAALCEALQHLVHLAGGWATGRPMRRPAYDSGAVRRKRRLLSELHLLERYTRTGGGTTAGCWPHRWEQLCSTLQRQGVVLPRTTVGALRDAVVLEIRAAQEALDQLQREMRRQRHARWNEALPGLWRDRPGVVYHWLEAPTAAWGCTPIVNDHGLQCVTTEAVDTAVRSYWVDQVLCQHR